MRERDYRIRTGRVYRLDVADGQVADFARELRRKSKRRVDVNVASRGPDGVNVLAARVPYITRAVTGRPERLGLEHRIYWSLPCDRVRVTPAQWLRGEVPNATIARCTSHDRSLSWAIWVGPDLDTEADAVLHVGCQIFAVPHAKRLLTALGGGLRREMSVRSLADGVSHRLRPTGTGRGIVQYGNEDPVVLSDLVAKCREVIRIHEDR